MVNRPEDYTYIAAWGRLLGRQHYYIENQQEQAAREGAPLDALYRRYLLKGWVTLRDLSENRRRELEAYIG